MSLHDTIKGLTFAHHYVRTDDLEQARKHLVRIGHTDFVERLEALEAEICAMSQELFEELGRVRQEYLAKQQEDGGG